MDKDEVQRLAKLARIEIEDSEAEKLSHEFEAILKYVEEVKEVRKIGVPKGHKSEDATRNIMREDSNPHESGKYSQKILNEAPGKQGNYIKVKKILG